MSFLTEWIVNIILLVMLATIIELLLPNTTMRRYVKMVVGILLLVVMLQPLLTILGTGNELDAWLFSLSAETDQLEEEVINLINLQKKEIELGQHAYISEQVAIDLEREITDLLLERFSFVIVQLHVEMVEDQVVHMSSDQIKKVHVYVAMSETANGRDVNHPANVKEVELVHIEATASKDVEKKKQKLEQLRHFFATHWGIPIEKITVIWRGGTKDEPE